MTQVSVESTDAKSLLPGYITVVVMTAWAKSSGITEGACFAIPLPFANLPSLQEDSCYNECSLLLYLSANAGVWVAFNNQ